MNLVAAISLHCGGPGSGRHPYGRKLETPSEWRAYTIIWPDKDNQFLKEHVIESKYAFVSLTSLVPKEATEKSHAESLAQQVTRSKRFEAIVAVQYGRQDKMFVEDGHHRLEALKGLGFRTTPAVVVRQKP